MLQRQQSHSPNVACNFESFEKTSPIETVWEENCQAALIHGNQRTRTLGGQPYANGWRINERTKHQKTSLSFEYPPRVHIQI